MKIAFFGLPLAALLLAADGHDIVYAGICRRSAIGTRRLQKRIGKDRVVVLPDPNSTAVEVTVRAGSPDLVVSWYWVKKLPRAIRDIAPLGSFGVHPSLLPRHRGPDPFFWAIDSGDETTGVTAHRLDDEYDTGAILSTRELRIDPAWTAWTLAKKLDRPSLALLRETATRFSRGKIAENAQREEDATLAPAPTEDELELDWTWNAARVVRRIRAASPWPGAFTFVEDHALTVTHARVVPLEEFPRALAPGEACVVGTGTSRMAVVRAADAGVALLRGRVDEGDDDEDAPDEAGEKSEGIESELSREGIADLVTFVRARVPSPTHAKNPEK